MRFTGFDLFGTLVSPDPDFDPYTEIVKNLEEIRDFDKEVFRDGYSRSSTEGQDTVGKYEEVALSSHLHGVMERISCPISQKEARQVVWESFTDAENTKVEGADKVVERANSIGKTCLVSNCSVEGLVEHVVSENNLDFDTVVSSVDIGYRKPDTQPFEEALSKIDIDAQKDGKKVYVGDSATDVIGARKAGFETCLVKYENKRKPKKEVRKEVDSDYSASSLGEVLEVIE